MPERLCRDKDRAVLGGVSAGLAPYFGVRPALVRLIWALLALANYTAPVVYLLLWVALPGASGTQWLTTEALRLNVEELVSQARSWSGQLQTPLGASACASPRLARHIVQVGGLLVVLGMMYLADALGLLGRFGLHHLGPVTLILIGALAANRALRVV